MCKVTSELDDYRRYARLEALDLSHSSSTRSINGGGRESLISSVLPSMEKMTPPRRNRMFCLDSTFHTTDALPRIPTWRPRLHNNHGGEHPLRSRFDACASSFNACTSSFNARASGAMSCLQKNLDVIKPAKTCVEKISQTLKRPDRLSKDQQQQESIEEPETPSLASSITSKMSSSRSCSSSSCLSTDPTTYKRRACPPTPPESSESSCSASSESPLEDYIQQRKAERQQRLERVRQRIAAEEAEEKRVQERKIKEEKEKKKALQNTEKARCERAYRLYHRLAMPTKDAYIRKIRQEQDAEVTEEDINLLPWTASGSMVNVTKMHSLLLSSK